MAKKTSKKSPKKSATKEPESVVELREHAKKIDVLQVPGDLQDRFGPQVQRVVNRLEKIADNLAKAIELGVTKAERDAKKAERIAKRKEKLIAQIKAHQAKLADLDK